MKFTNNIKYYVKMMESITQKIILNIEDLCQKYEIVNTSINKVINSNVYVDSYWTLKPDEIKNLRENYKIIDVDWFDRPLVNY